MADRYPLIVDSSTSTVKEIASGDNLNLSGNGIVNADSIGISSGSASETKLQVGSGDATFTISGISSVGIGTTFAGHELHVVGDKYGFTASGAAGVAVNSPKGRALLVEGRANIGVSTDNHFFGMRAGALSVTYDSPITHVLGIDPGDERRNTSFIAREHNSPVIVCMRNVSSPFATTGIGSTSYAFWDFIADPVTSNFYVQSRHSDQLRGSLRPSVSIASTTGFIGLGTTAMNRDFHLVGDPIGFNSTTGAGFACFQPALQNFRVEGRGVIGISTDLYEETGIGGCRAGALTVAYDTRDAYPFGADPGDERRTMSLVGSGSSTPVILCMRNVTTETFFDWVVEPLTDRLYLYTQDQRGIPAMSVDMSNRVGFGTTAVDVSGGLSGTQFYVNGGMRYTSRPSAASVTALGVDALGIVRESTSSRRFKENIVEYSKGLSEVEKLNPVTFNYIGEEEVTLAGLIAEDVHDSGLNEFVIYEEDKETPKAINYGHMMALMTNAVKELKAENDSLKEEIAAIKAHIGL